MQNLAKVHFEDVHKGHLETLVNTVIQLSLKDRHI